jgi:hypothetical protein
VRWESKKENALFQVQVQLNLIVPLKLEDQKRVSRLSLSNRGIQSNNKHPVQLIRLGKEKELCNGLVENLVVVRLSSKTHKVGMHLKLEPAAI